MPALTLSISETLIFLGMVALVWVMLNIQRHDGMAIDQMEPLGTSISSVSRPTLSSFEDSSNGHYYDRFPLVYHSPTIQTYSVSGGHT